MAQYLPLPDGSSLKLREGETPAQGWARAQQAYPEAFATAKPAEEPKGGFVPATKAGISSLKSDIAGLLGRTGVIDIPTAEKYMQEQEEYQRRVFKPTEKGFLEAPGTKVAELLGGSIPYMAAPLVVGAGATTLPVSAPLATAVGIGGAGLTSALQFTGSNLARQVEEGKRLAETELGSAAAAALPQAALDMVSFRMMPGIRRIFMQAGKEVPEAAAKKIAEQGVKDIAKDYALATGKSMGTEGLTEAGQQVLERLQAGLNIADPAARSEYFDSFIGGAVLGGAISPAGRFIERGSERRKQEVDAARLRVEEQRKLQEQKDQERAGELGTPLLTKEEAERPLFVDSEGKVAKFTDLQERERMLQEKEQAKKDAQQQYTEITKTINDLREQAQTAGRNRSVELGQEAQRLEKLKDALEARVADKKDPIYKTKLQPFTQLTQEEAEGKLTTYDALQKKIKQAQGNFDKAKDQGDVIAQGKAAQKLKDLQEELRGTTPDLFGVEGQKVIEERKKADELEERRTVFNAALLMLGKRAERAQSREELEEITTQQEALKKLEFGLERMSLNVLGVTGAKRIKREAELNKGVINPVMAKKLGIYDDQFSALEARLAKAATPEEAATIEKEVTALEQKANKPTRAVDALDDIETAYQNALAKQKETVDAVAANQFNPFDAKGQLTPQGKLAVANEAILRQLANLRRLGRESKETMEAQRVEDLFAEAPTTGAARMQRIAGEAGTKPKTELEAQKVGTEFSSRNEAFESLSDSAYFLQRGSFTGTREKGVGLAGAEERRNAQLEQKVQALKKELAQVVRKQLDPKTQNLPSLAKRQAVLEGRIKKLGAGLTTRLKDPELIANDTIEELNKIREETGRPPLTENEQKRVAKDIIENFQPEVTGTLGPQERQLVPYKQEVARAERAVDYLIADALKDIEASRLARGIGPMPPSDARNVETKLRIEFNNFISRVSAAERTTGEMEKKPVGVKMVDGKPVVVKKLRPKKPPEAYRAYEKLGVALKTLRNELEGTITEAKGIPAKGEFEEEPVEVVKPVKEKPVKTTKKKIAEREKAAKHEGRKREAVAAGKQVVSENQKQMRRLEKQLRTTGAEITRLKKAALKDKNPQMRLAKVERLEKQMEQMRNSLLELKNTNKGLAAALRTLGVETSRTRSAAYILDMIENGEYLIKEEMSEAGLGDKTVERVQQLQKIKAEQEKSLAATEATANALERRLNLLTLFGVKLKIAEGSKIKTRDDLRKQVEFQKRLVSQTKSEINKTQREIFSYLKRGFGEEAKEPEVSRRFTGYEVDLAAKFLRTRIDQTLARMEKAQKVIDENDKLIKAQLGTITTPTGKTLPGIRVTTDLEWSPKALNDTAQQQRELYQRQYEDAVAEREAIAEKLRAAGKPIRGNPEYEKAASEARNKARSRNAVKDFIYDYVPVRTKQQIFATDADVKETLGRRQRQTADFVESKTDEDIETAKDVHAMLVEDVLLAQEALRNIPADDKTSIKKAKAALVAAKNRLSKGSIYQLRAALTREEMKETLAQAEENTNTVKKGARKGKTEFNVEGVLDIDAGTVSDKDIIDSIDYRDDTIDPRFGEEPTELIDEKEAIKLLDKVKEKLRSQGFGKEKPTGPDMTRRRLVQGIGAGLAVPKMPTNIVKAFQAVKLTPESVWDAIQPAQEWFDSILESLPKSITSGAKRDEFYKIQRMAVYNSLERIASKDAADFVDSLEYADPIEVFLDYFIENNKDPNILKKMQRAYDVAAVDVFKQISNQLKTTEREAIQEEKASESKVFEVKKETEPFEYYMSVEELPIGIRKQMAKQGMDTVASQLRGGVYKGKVFVIVQNHNDIVDLQKTLAHELIGHYSFDGLLGKEGMIKLSQQIYKTPGGLDKLAKDLGLTDVVNGVFADTVRYYKQAFDDGKITEAQIRANANIKAMREMVAYTMEKEVTASRMEKLGYWYKALVGAMRAALRKLGLDLGINTNDLFYLMKQAKRNFEAGKPVAYRDADDMISFRSTGAPPPQTGLGAMVAPRGKMFDTLKANLTGLNFRTQFVDRLAALDALIKRGVDAGLIDSLKGFDVMYFSRKADQLNNMAAQFVTNGVGKIAKIKGEYQYVGGDGPSMKDVSQALSKSGLPANQVENEFTQYEIALRAKDVGLDKLDFTGKIATQKDVDDIIAKYSGKDPASLAFQEAHKLYQQYNRDLIDFVVSSGAMLPQEGARLKSMNYVPYYRVRNGVAELVVTKEQTFRIGDMKNQPYLDRLIGGEEKILPVFTGAVQNTQLLIDMAMKNMATRNTAFVLAQMGVAELHKGKGPADANVIRYKIDGDDKWARVNIEAKKDIFGDIPTELVVMGMEGIKATLPVGVRLLGMPADLLRKFVTRDPRYAVRQIFRDSMSAVLTTGANFVPVVQTVKDIATMKKGETYKKLQGSGSLGGQVITGATDDMDKILLQIASGKRGWAMAMSKLDELAMMGDAATRVSMYNSFIKQGLSEREADFATMEAMNFSRRGLSPTMMYANTMIPFFNAGVQGIDVLYRAFKGDMPASQRLNIQRKLITRGVMMGVMTMLYAAAMDDDETYKNANPDERYNNWFVPTPLGTLRVPIPFEAGFIFKGIPEGVYRMAFTDDKNSDVLEALKDLAIRSIPLDMPTVAKPMVELMLNRSFFTGREIVDKSMSEIAKYQYRPNTPELIKLFGEIGFSPAKVEYFIKGYTGSLPLGLISAFENVTGISSAEKEKPAMRIYDMPIVGGLFQPPDASGMINRAYETVNRVQGAKTTYNRLLETDPKEAEEFLQQNLRDLQIAEPAGWFRQQMGDITQYERIIRESRTLTADEKRERLDKTKQIKIDLSKQFSKVSGQIERRADLQ